MLHYAKKLTISAQYLAELLYPPPGYTSAGGSVLLDLPCELRCLCRWDLWGAGSKITVGGCPPITGGYSCAYGTDIDELRWRECVPAMAIGIDGLPWYAALIGICTFEVPR